METINLNSPIALRVDRSTAINTGVELGSPCAKQINLQTLIATIVVMQSTISLEDV